jgi:hypothetical protein
MYPAPEHSLWPRPPFCRAKRNKQETVSRIPADEITINPQTRSAASASQKSPPLATLVDEAKQTGVVQKAIDAKGLRGVNVATK